MSDKEPFLVVRYQGQYAPESEGPKSMTLVYPTDMATGMHKEVRYTFGYDGSIVESTGLYKEPRIKRGIAPEELDRFAYSEDKGNALSTRQVGLEDAKAAIQGITKTFHDTRYFPYDPENPNDRQTGWSFTRMEYEETKQPLEWSRLEAAYLPVPPIPVATVISRKPNKPKPPDYVAIYEALCSDESIRQKGMEIIEAAELVPKVNSFLLDAQTLLTEEFGCKKDEATAVLSAWVESSAQALMHRPLQRLSMDPQEINGNVKKLLAVKAYMEHVGLALAKPKAMGTDVDSHPLLVYAGKMIASKGLLDLDRFHNEVYRPLKAYVEHAGKNDPEASRMLTLLTEVEQSVVKEVGKKHPGAYHMAEAAKPKELQPASFNAEGINVEGRVHYTSYHHVYTKAPVGNERQIELFLEKHGHDGYGLGPTETFTNEEKSALQEAFSVLAKQTGMAITIDKNKNALKDQLGFDIRTHGTKEQYLAFGEKLKGMLNKFSKVELHQLVDNHKTAQRDHTLMKLPASEGLLLVDGEVPASQRSTQMQKPSYAIPYANDTGTDNAAAQAKARLSRTR